MAGPGTRSRLLQAAQEAVTAARARVDSINSPYPRVDGLVWIAEALATTDASAAMHAASAARAVAETIDDPRRLTLPLCSVAKALAAAGDTTAALEAATAAREAADALDDHYDKVMFLRQAAQRIEVSWGKPTDQGPADTIDDPSRRAFVRVEIAMALASAGDMTAAREAATAAREAATPSAHLSLGRRIYVEPRKRSRSRET